MDLIDRQDAVNAIYHHFPQMSRVDAERVLYEVPSAEPSLQDWQKIVLRTLISERKTGQWIESNPQNSTTCRLINCSECGKGYIVGFNVSYEDWIEAHKYCVECGAKMEVDNE